VASLFALAGIAGTLSRLGARSVLQAEVHTEPVPAGQSLDHDASLKALQDAVTAGLKRPSRRNRT